MALCESLAMSDALGDNGFLPDVLTKCPRTRLIQAVAEAFRSESNKPSFLFQDPVANAGISSFMKGTREAKQNALKQHGMPPEKVEPMTKELLSVLAGSRARFEEMDGKDRRMRQIYLSALPEFSKVHLEDLAELSISQLMVRKTHKGFYLPCRIVSKAVRVIAVDFAVEDPYGALAHVSVYNYPFTLDASVSEVDSIFPVGAVLGIREPTYKLSGSSLPFIRVDSPSDIVFIDDHPGCLPGRSWSFKKLDSIPSHLKSDEEWKSDGAKAFKQQKWYQAAIAFSEGLKVNPANHALILNRIEAYLRMGWFNRALAEARRALTFDDLSSELRVKAVGRAARACYGLEKYERAISFTEQFPNDPALIEIRRKCLKRKDESENGKYDWAELRGQAEKKPRLDIASYLGPIEIKESPTLKDQRGVFVTQDVKAGELLLVSKPLASHLEEDNPTRRSLLAYDLSICKIYEYSHYSAAQNLVNRLWDDVDLARRLANMYAGPDFPVRSITTTTTTGFNNRPLPSHPRSPVTDVDFRRLLSVLKCNAFDTKDPNEAPSEKGEETDKVQAQFVQSLAIYDLPSFFNHSCVANAHRLFVGEVCVVRASCAMKAGEEVTIRYFPECENDSDPLNGIKSQRVWGFLCSCKLCVAKRIDGPEVVEKCKALVKHVSSIPVPNLHHAMSTLSQLEAIYGQPHWKDVPCKGNLSRAYISASIAVHASGSTRQAFKYIFKAFESDGIFISLARDGDKGLQKKNPLDVTIDIKAEPSRPFNEHVMCIFLLTNTGMLSKGDNVEVRSWIKAAMMLSDIAYGGGKELFMRKFGQDFSMVAGNVAASISL